METLVPPILTATQEVRWLIASGKSMKEAFRLYLESSNDPLAADFRERWTLKWQTKSGPSPHHRLESPYRSALWELVERGCDGQPVLQPLQSLEQEVEAAAQAELELHIATLPFKVLIPLLFFQFPAHLILLLGPMLREFHQQLGAS